MPAGSAILADWTQAAILVREDVATLAATQATVDGVNLWETNQVVVRSEGRYGFKVRRPQAFAVVELTEGS
jgi:Phage capsid family